jgi:hypothetical protein
MCSLGGAHERICTFAHSNDKGEPLRHQLLQLVAVLILHHGEDQLAANRLETTFTYVCEMPWIIQRVMCAFVTHTHQ